MDVRFGPERRLSTKALMLSNCGAREDSWESKGNQSWIFIGRADAKAEAPVLWPPEVKSQLFRKDPDAGKDWRQEEKGMTKDETVGRHHWFSGHEFEQTLRISEGQGSLACCTPSGCKESDTTEWLNNNWGSDHSLARACASMWEWSLWAYAWNCIYKPSWISISSSLKWRWQCHKDQIYSVLVCR